MQTLKPVEDLLVEELVFPCVLPKRTKTPLWHGDLGYRVLELQRKNCECEVCAEAVGFSDVLHLLKVGKYENP